MRTLLFAMAACVMLAASLWADVTGSISGTVNDNTGAVMVGVTVTATNQNTGLKRAAQTDTGGTYTFLALPVGVYQIEVHRPGFRDFRQKNITLDVNSALRINIPLQVGSVTETVEVSANPVQVETTNTQMGDVIEEKRITTQPLNGRSYIDLLGLQPGVVPVNSGNSKGTVSGNLAGGNVSVSGNRENANGFMVNGGNVEEQRNNGAAVIPNLDSIAEFRVLTNSFDAEYGHFAGGLVNVITKSGTNAFHGSGFEFYRNQILDGNNWFNNYHAVDRGDYHRNQYGGTFGGPIIHNKVFFFGDYQGTREKIGTPLSTIVPGDAERNGDLSALAGDLTGAVNGTYWAGQLAQRLGYPVTEGESYYTAGCTTTAQCVFPGAQIPTSAFAAPVKPLLAYIPAPNGTLKGQPSFSTSAFNNVLHDNKWGARIDGNSRFGMLSAYYFFDQSLVDNPYPSADVPGFNATSPQRAQQVNLSDTKTFGATKVNEFRFNFLRNATVRTQYVGGLGIDPATLGFAGGSNGALGIAPAIAGLASMPPISTNNWTIGPPNGETGQSNNTFQWMDNFSLIHGSHSLKFGGEFHYAQINERNIYAPNGSFNFNGSETGSDLADFLIGAVATYTQATQQTLDSRTEYIGLYGQDSWKVRPDLTFNYGLRWEVSPFWWDTQNKIQTIVPGLQSVIYPGSPAGWVFPGDPGIPRTLAPTGHRNFAPRFGVAYSPSAERGLLGKLLGGAGKSSIRASWGMFYTSTDDSQLFVEVGDAPFGLYYQAQGTMFDTPFVDRATGVSAGQRFPRPLPRPGDTNIDWAAFLPISSSPGIWIHDKLPYTENYSLSFQRQLTGSMLVSISYVGSQGHRQLAAVEANPGDPNLCLRLKDRSNLDPSSPVCGPNGENDVYTLSDGTTISGTRSPLGINFGAGNQYMATIATSNYNSLQTSLRYSATNTSFLIGYTYSKALDDSSVRGDALNPFTWSAPQAPSAYDMKHNFVASYTIGLPFDKLVGHRSRLLSGWAISGVTRFGTGFPITLSDSGDRSLIGTSGIDRPQFLGGDLSTNDPRKNLDWIDNPKKTCGPAGCVNGVFDREPIGQIGNARRRMFYGPGLNDTDLALLKSVGLTESKTLQFRAEFFNAFNHAQFLNPSGSVASSSFMLISNARDPRIGQLAVKFLF